MHHRLTLTASAVASLFVTAAPAFAQNDEATIVVTATRFAETEPRVPANISVLTRQDIEQSPARNIPDLLGKLPGVEVRPLYGPLGIDATVDLRGSGETAISNTLILVDGHRINAVDLTGIQWNTIPLDAIQRIEVVRGSGTVLYGDRATGGVINIVTDPGGKPRATGRAEAGSYGYRALDAYAAGRTGAWSGSLAAHDAQTDGYRQNSDARQSSFSASGGYRDGGFDASLAASTFDQEQGLPSQLTQAEYDATPRLASTPKYRLARKGYRVQPGAGMQLTPDVRLEFDLSHTDETLDASNPDWFYQNHRRVRSFSAAPRVRLAHGLPGAVASETVAGADFFAGQFESYDPTAPVVQAAEQENAGVFAQNTTRWTDALDTTLGLRSQSFRQEVSEQGSALHAERTDRIEAWELGAGYRPLPALRTYAKLARNFRLPNADELFAFDCSAFPCTTLFNGPLKAQEGRLVEGGLSYRGENAWTQLAAYRQENTDEIGYIAANGRNANLDPTKRQGIEWEGKLRVAQPLSLRASLTRQSARFTEGAFAGKSIPLVATHKESVGATWQGGALGTHTLNAVRNGSRYFGGDFANSGRKLPAYTLADYQGEWKAGKVTLGLRVNNLTNQKYSASGFSNTYYPADPRTVFVSGKVALY